MKKLPVLIFTIMLLLFTPVILAEEAIETSLSTNELSVYSGETAQVDLTIKNNRDKFDSFATSIFPSFLNKVTAFPETRAVNLPLASKDSATVKLYLSVLPEAEETFYPVVFKIFVSSLANPNISSNKTVQLSVLRTSPVYLSDFRVSKSAVNPEEQFGINNIITNTRSSLSDIYRLQVSIKKDNSVVKSFDETISGIAGKTSQPLTLNYAFDRYASPGVYTINANLKDNLNTLVSVKSLDVRVNEVNKTLSESLHEFKLLTVNKIIKVKNVGNVPTTVSLKESVPAFAKDWVITESTPSSIVSQSGFVIYEWVRSVDPGQEVSVKYQFNLWNVWIGMIIIVFAVYYAFKYVFAPSVTKVVKVHGALTRGKEIIVTLEVKNRSLNEVKDIVITDVVPQLTEVIQKFDTVKPVIRKTAEGAELSWKLDSLKATEERVFNYRIKPTIDVIGSIELPSSTMRYSDHKKAKRFVVSRAVSVKAK